jgi:energy-coupling factor transporter transmembrane protein EcfT
MKNIASENIKFIVSILLSALMAYAIGIYGNLPWWSFVVTNFIIAIVVNQKPGKSFLSGALGIGVLWLVLALVIDTQNNHILSVKVANILPLKGSYIALIIITSVVGFLLGGLSSLTGSFVRKS